MHTKRTKIENEVLRLFEFGVEEEFYRCGEIALDSSLGLMPTPRPSGQGRRSSGPKH